MLISTIMFIVFILYVVSCFTLYITKISKKEFKGKTITQAFSIVLLISLICFSVFIGYQMNQATDRGVENPQKLTIPQIITGNQTIPFQSKTRKINLNKTNLIIFYKFGCSDCTEHLPKIREMLKNEKNVFYLNKNNTDTKLFLERNDIIIENVPSAIVIKPKVKGKELDITKYTLYSETINESHFEKERLIRLLEVKNQEK